MSYSTCIIKPSSSSKLLNLFMYQNLIPILLQSASWSCDEEATGDDLDLQICNKIKSELDVEFQSEITISKSFEVHTHWSKIRIEEKRHVAAMRKSEKKIKKSK